MKNLIKLIIVSLFSLFILSGCTLKANYSMDYISKNIKQDLPKVEKTVCIEETTVPKTSKTYRGQILFTTSLTNQEVLNNYLKQYFAKVSYKNDNSCYLYIQSSVENLESTFTNLDGMDAKFDLNVSVFKQGKNILQKTYHGYKDSQVMIALGIIGLSAPYKTANEAFHKELLELYENEVEKDFLKAIRENK